MSMPLTQTHAAAVQDGTRTSARPARPARPALVSSIGPALVSSIGPALVSSIGPALRHLGLAAEQTAQTLLQKNDFEIHLTSERRVDEVQTLVTRMYRQRGYVTTNAGSVPAEHRASVTLEALREGRTIGTLTVNVGDHRRLNAEELYADEIAPYRREGGRVCEFTRLAMDCNESSKEALGSLFHVGFAFAYRIFRAGNLFIEVNPRHALFYRRKLGFNAIGEQRICARVCAPAVLLHKELAACAEELRHLGGSRVPSNKSFYAFVLTPAEETILLQNIARRLAPRS
jgi:hypothetical protein